MQSKKELRQDFKKVVSNLDSRWVEAASHNVGKNLSQILKDKVPQTIDHLLCFAAFFPGEVNLTNFISEQIKQRKVYLPTLHQDGKMAFISVESDWEAAATTGAYGISEPSLAVGVAFSPDNASSTAVIVPALVFDRHGNRLGRGKGYYDRFLANRRFKGMVKIGACWEMQIIEEVPSESHDIAMDWLCHERGSIKTGAIFEDE